MEQAEKRAKKLQETYDSWGWLGGYEDVLDRIRQPGKELYAPMSTVNDRRHGHNWPFWRTWAEHARLRASARLLAQLSPMAGGALQGLSAYVIGTGYTYRATTTQSAPSALVEAVQDIIDEFVRENNWPALEQEGFIRSRRDGELFHLHEPESGRLYVCTIEPEQVQQPPGEVDEEYSYGIETRGRRTDKPLRYNVIEDADPDNNEEYTPDELFHLKLNVDRKVKRGLTDLCYDTHDALRTAGRLVDHVGQGAAIQASIAFIRQHETADPSAVQDFVTAASDYDRYDPIAGATEYSERFQPGKILDIDKGQSYVVPPFASNVSGYIEVIQGILRSVAVKWNAPEWIVSADASNNNYSSSITAESPFVKRCSQEQERYKEFYRRSVLLAIKVAAAAGRIRAHGRVWTAAEVMRLVDVQVEAPNIEVRDDFKTAQTDSVYITNGVKSVQTTRQQLGLDDAQETANILATKKAGTGQQQGQGGDQANPDDPSAVLRGSVGGAQALLTLQQSYYQKQLPREAVIATARVVYGFTEEDAALLFPEIAPDAPTPEPEPGADMGGMGGDDLPPDDAPPDGGGELPPQEDGENPLDDILGGGMESFRRLLEGDFTDSLGRHYCTDPTTGHRVKCNEAGKSVMASHKRGHEQIVGKFKQARGLVKQEHQAKREKIVAGLKAKLKTLKKEARAKLRDLEAQTPHERAVELLTNEVDPAYFKFLDKTDAEAENLRQNIKDYLGDAGGDTPQELLDAMDGLIDGSDEKTLSSYFADEEDEDGSTPESKTRKEAARIFDMMRVDVEDIAERDSNEEYNPSKVYTDFENAVYDAKEEANAAHKTLKDKTRATYKMIAEKARAAADKHADKHNQMTSDVVAEHDREEAKARKGKGRESRTRVQERETKDKRGYRICYDDATGRRTKCAPKEKAPAKKRAPKAQPEAKKPRNLGSNKQTSPAQVKQAHADLLAALDDPAKAVEALGRYNFETLKALGRELGQKLNGGALALAKRLAAALAQEKPAEEKTTKPDAIERVQAGIVAHLRDFNAKHRSENMPLRDLYEAIAAPEGLSIDEFHSVLRKLWRDGQVHLAAYTQAPAAMKDREYSLPDGNQFRAYASIGRAAREKPAEKAPEEKPTPEPEKTEKTPETRSLPSPEELAGGEWSGLGNEAGNTDLMRVRVGGREYVVKQMQRPDGVEAEAAAGALARSFGVSVPEVARTRPAPENVKDWKGFRFAEDDGWSVMPHAQGRPITDADLKNPKVRAAVLRDLLAAYALGNEDRNDGNLLVDGDSVTSLDWEPSFGESTDPDTYAQRHFAGSLPDETPLDRATLARIVSSGGDILRAAAGFTHLPTFTEDRSKIGKKADSDARDRLEVLRHLAGLPSPTLGDFRKGLAAARQEVPAEKPQEKPAPQKAEKKPAKEKPASVDDAAATLQQLYERTTDADLSHDDIAREVDRIAAQFDAKGLKAVAKAFGMAGGLTTKQGIRDRIFRRIADRKGAVERGDSIARQAEVKPERPAPQKTPEVKRTEAGEVDWDSFSFDPDDTPIEKAQEKKPAEPSHGAHLKQMAERDRAELDVHEDDRTEARADQHRDDITATMIRMNALDEKGLRAAADEAGIDTRGAKDKPALLKAIRKAISSNREFLDAEGDYATEKKATPQKTANGIDPDNASVAERRKEWERSTAAGQRMHGEVGHNPRGYEGMPSGVDAERFTQDATEFVKAAKKRSALTRPTLKQMYQHMAEKHPGLTIGQFQQAMTQLHKDRRVVLGAYTLASATVKDDDLPHTFPLDKEQKFYVDDGPNIDGRAEKGSNR